MKIFKRISTDIFIKREWLGLDLHIWTITKLYYYIFNYKLWDKALPNCQILWYLITPMYLLEFLGAKSRLMSMRGVPLTLRSSRMRVVSSSLESESLSNIARWEVDRRNSVKFEWMKSTAENREEIKKNFLQKSNLNYA